jgi:hypothetical protein
MPNRYFFHLHNSTGFVEDQEGQELPGVEEARQVALASIRSIVSDESKSGSVDLRGRVEVMDEAGECVLVLPFSEAITVRTAPPPSAREEPGVSV